MTTPADAYNYDVFDPAPYVSADCDGPRAGEHLDGVSVHRVDGSATTLAALGDGPIVIETGSTTCPLYRRNIGGMRRIAAEHPEATFIVLYTREAHPGERRGAHRDMDDKCAAASSLPAAAGEWRTIVIDDLDGTLHRRLEGAPDSVTILDGDGTVRAYFHDGDPTVVGDALDRLHAGRSVEGLHARFLPPPPHIALRALLTGGWLAVRDFVRGLPQLAVYRLRGGQRC